MRIEVAVPIWVSEGSYVAELGMAASRCGLMLMQQGGQPVELEVTHVVETGSRMVQNELVPADQHIRLSAAAYKP